jgi:hypothetical protein
MSDPLSSQQKADGFRGRAYKSLQTAGQRASGGGQVGMAAPRPYNGPFSQNSGYLRYLTAHLTFLRDTQREQP